MLIVLCGGHRYKLGGQDRRWLRVASLLCTSYKYKVLINESYYKLGKETEIDTSSHYTILHEPKNKIINYILQNILIFWYGLREDWVYFSSNALSGMPAAIALYLLGKKISFSYTGVSANILYKSNSRKQVLILKTMNKIARKIEILNKTTEEEKFFDHKKVFVSNAMYAGPQPNLTPKNPRKIVFSGNFIGLKGINTLANIIKSQPNEYYHFSIYGGFLETTDEDTKKIIEQIKKSKNVSFFGHVNDMSTAYSDATVVLSLQTISNYPSQVVLEALANGCSAVITQTGDSERFGNGPGIFYVPAEFNSDKYWDAIQSASKFSATNTAAISESALAEFSTESYAKHFIQQHKN